MEVKSGLLYMNKNTNTPVLVQSVTKQYVYYSAPETQGKKWRCTVDAFQESCTPMLTDAPATPTDIAVPTVWLHKDTPEVEVTVHWVTAQYVGYYNNITLDAFELPVGEFLLQYQRVPPEVTTSDAVHSPKHYHVFPDKEAIEVIASSLSKEQFYGYCLGNFLKYRLRLGAKDVIEQELAKSNKYKELFEKYKHLST